MADVDETPPSSTPVLPHPRILAHLGDAVYELYVREKAAKTCPERLETVHQYTTARVNGAFQAKLLAVLFPHLSIAEQDWVRRGRNLPVSVKRRSDHQTHRLASGFEALIGYLHLSDPARLSQCWHILDPYLENPDQLSPLPPEPPL